MRKAIVTGANGFIGQWLLRELRRQGVAVTAVLREGRTLAPETADAEIGATPLRIVHCDAQAYAQLPELIPERDFDWFFHLAWAGNSGAARGDARLQLENAACAAEAARAAAALGCARFIGAGSLAEKDCQAYIPLDGARPSPVSCYGTAKIAAHYCTKAACADLGIEHIWLHLPNTYGEGNRTQNFVNFAALRLLKGERAAFTSGEQLYEFMHVADTVRGMRAAAASGKAFHAYYIGDRPQPLKQYILDIRDAIDPALPLYLGEIPFQGTPQPQEAFDAAALRADTGFAAEVPFARGIRRTLDWLRAEIEEGRL